MTSFAFSHANCAEVYKIKPVKFDISNSIIFIPIKTSPQSVITNDLKYSKIENVNGVELELVNSSFDVQPDEMNFSEGNLKDFTIKRDGKSTKITLIFKDNFNLENLKIGNINNNLIITITPLQPYNMNYYVNTYRESDAYSKDYKETLMVTKKTVNKQQNPVVNVSNVNSKSMNEINQAFANSTANNEEVYTDVVIEDLSKNNKLRSKYYLAEAKAVDNLFRLVGVGTTTVQKPFLLPNPMRVVYDMPNTTVNPDLHNTEIALVNGDKLKVAQFNPNTTRMVITSETAAQYIPVFNPDSQTMYMANPKNILTTHLPDKKANIVKFNFQKSNKQENFIFEFDKPLCYAIKRTSEYLFIYFLNAEKYNDNSFNSAKKNTPYSDLSIHLLTTGMRVSLPEQDRENISTYISPDGKVFKITCETKHVEPVLTEAQIKELTKKEGAITSSPKYTREKNSKVIVIDAGHGGKDCGALRDNIFEKDITMEVSKKVQNILQKKGYKVYMTRTDDTYVSLEDRTIFTEGINPALFVSIHVNSCNSENPRGIETHYYHDNSLELADYVHRNLTKKISHTTNRGLFKSRFYVINHTTVPAILVEIGFISNTAERNELITNQRQQTTAEGIADGIIEYLKNNR
ncbi:MAG: N-acetylmuramoyl-L-alanine amidase [Cyanobacteria bacterium RUI128]|nr:N-acetylmuramoyl-L-alanine amidase [Cyanobacteria bacterium RUI128]